MFAIEPLYSLEVKIIYDESDRSIVSLPHSKLKTGLMVSINYLQFELAKNGVIVGVNGFCPHECWQFKQLKLPTFDRVDIYYKNVRELTFGSVPRLNEKAMWPVFYSAENGVLCIDSGLAAAVTAAEILPGVVIEIDGNGKPLRLWCSLWNSNEINEKLGF